MEQISSFKTIPHSKKKQKAIFSYVEEDKAKCVFFSGDEIPRVVFSATFDSTFNIQTAKIDTIERKMTERELSLQVIRDKASVEVQSDSLFLHYSNTSFNMIPLVEGDEKKVYVLTGPQVTGVVIFGNDYLLTFDKDNNLVSKKALHKNIIPIEYSQSESETDSEELPIGVTMHSHTKSTGELITPTDICTLMLYAKYAKWETHYVIGPNMISIWDCKKNNFATLTKEAFERISNDIEEKEDKKEKN